MAFQLVVVQAFGSHAIGDLIADPAAVAKILASENVGAVVRVAGEPGSRPSPAPSPALADMAATVVEK